MFTVSTYRGIVSGWRVITVTDDQAKADRMLNLASRIFSAYPNRLR